MKAEPVRCVSGLACRAYDNAGPLCYPLAVPTDDVASAAARKLVEA